MGLIRLLFIILAVYLAFKYILKPLLRVFIQSAVKKVVEKEMGKFGGTQKPPRKEGTIQVDYIPDNKASKPSSKQKDGEYVDYEEVK